MTDQRYLKRTINKEVVTSRHLPEGARNLRVYLPPGYNELLSYPVVYCQDGEEFFNFGRIATIANQLILDEGVEPFIIVGVDVDKKLRTAEYSPDGDRHEGYVSFFGEELIPFIEEKYPVRGSHPNRILAGDSLGGSVSPPHRACLSRLCSIKLFPCLAPFIQSPRHESPLKPIYPAFSLYDCRTCRKPLMRPTAESMILLLLTEK